jgi:UDP-glucose 4-epimerase
MRVVVTGGAGFIGANLCAQFSTHRQTTEVIALDDLSTGFASNLGDVDAKLVVGSILDRDVLADTVDTADAVVHLAARPSVPRSLADPVAAVAVPGRAAGAARRRARNHGRVVQGVSATC